jgi:competence protein ComEC
MAGILVRFQYSISPCLTIPVIIITFLIAFSLTLFRKFSGNFKFRWIFGLNIYVFLFCLGIYLTGEKYQITVHNLEKTETTSEFIGVIANPPEEKTNSFRFLMDIDQEKRQGKFIGCTETVLVYLKKDSASRALVVGDAILFKAKLEDIEASGNPYEFDFKKYMSNQGIRFSCYINLHAWKHLARGKLWAPQIWACQMSNKLESIFTRLGLKGQEYGVASALILGDKSGLDNEIKQAYVASGTMHILAVSGMHVALLYWVLNLLLSFLDKNVYGKYFKLVILLLTVWFYALITGLGGSILRASAMITFVIIGQALDRKINIFNSLAASAFLLLLINPYILVDAGFQLSYIAVISIVIFHPMIYRWLDIKNWFGDQLWSLTAVTLAAQVITTPVTLYYFHQFPNLFLLSNLIMIPLSTLIMYFAMALIVCSPWNWLAVYMGKIFNFLVWLLNKVVLTIEGLPCALTKGIYITWFEVCFLYILICFITLYLIKKQAIHLISGLSLIFLLLLFGFIRDFTTCKTKQVIVYKEMNNTVIQFRNGNYSTWLVGKENERIKGYVERSRDAMHCENNQVLLLDSAFRKSREKGLSFESGLWIRGNFLQFGAKKIVVSNSSEFSGKAQFMIDVDYLVIRNNVLSRSELTFKNFRTPYVILDASNAKYKARKLAKIFSGGNVTVVNMANSGAVKLDM